MNTPKLLAAAVLVTTMASGMVHAADSINFGIISTESSKNLKQTWEPLLKDMESRTGMKVNAFFASDYAGIIEGMRFNKVQVAWFGNKSAMEAVDRSSGEVFAKTVAPNGSEGYYSLLVVHKDSPLKSLQDVLAKRKELRLGYGDPNSTSGTLVPGYYAFTLNDVDPTKDFARMVRANHQTNLLAVESKQVDVATNNSENWDRFAMTHAGKLANLRQIWQSPLIPSDPMVWRTDLDPKAKSKVSEFLIGYGKDDREKAILKELGLAGFKPSDNGHLTTVRQLDLVKKKLDIEQSDKLSAAEKAQKIGEIDAQLKSLAALVAKK